jgi:hypothetical protein
MKFLIVQLLYAKNTISREQERKTVITKQVLAHITFTKQKDLQTCKCYTFRTCKRGHVTHRARKAGSTRGVGHASGLTPILPIYLLLVSRSDRESSCRIHGRREHSVIRTHGLTLQASSTLALFTCSVVYAY